ncbi:MAG TPA: hypothetical protein VEH07_08045 [Alphaproteobacteria bacterium]|nr:hypothetical protein [Alphaproteobacteria bacterium]
MTYLLAGEVLHRDSIDFAERIRSSASFGGILFRLRDQIRQGKEHWIVRKFKLPAGDDHEFIPAPDSPPLS